MGILVLQPLAGLAGMVAKTGGLVAGAGGRSLARARISGAPRGGAHDGAAGSEEG